MMKATIYVNWDNHFITTDPFEAVDKYLEFEEMTMEEYAIENGMEEYLDENEELSDTIMDNCITSIFSDIECSPEWDCEELTIID